LPCNLSGLKLKKGGQEKAVTGLGEAGSRAGERPRISGKKRGERPQRYGRGSRRRRVTLFTTSNGGLVQRPWRESSEKKIALKRKGLRRAPRILFF